MEHPKPICAVMLVLAAACCPSYAAQPPDGDWAGTTSQGKAFSFTVAGGAVTQMALEWSLPLPAPCQVQPGSPVAPVELGGKSQFYFYANSPGNTPPKIAAGAWKLERDTRGDPVVHMSFSASLKGAEFAGTLGLTSAACKGNAKLTWTAKKK